MELKKHRSSSGFTMIEMVVTVGIFVMLAILLTQTFLQLTRVNDRIGTQVKLKEEADAVLNVMTARIRNAKEITVCASNTITFVDRFSPVLDSISYSLDTSTSQIASVSGNTSSKQYLNSSDSDVSNFTILCEKGAAGELKIVRLSFTLSRTAPISASYTASGMVGLRNY